MHARAPTMWTTCKLEKQHSSTSNPRHALLPAANPHAQLVQRIAHFSYPSHSMLLTVHGNHFDMSHQSTEIGMESVFRLLSLPPAGLFDRRICGTRTTPRPQHCRMIQYPHPERGIMSTESVLPLMRFG